MSLPEPERVVGLRVIPPRIDAGRTHVRAAWLGFFSAAVLGLVSIRLLCVLRSVFSRMKCEAAGSERWGEIGAWMCGCEVEQHKHRFFFLYLPRIID